jgi:hypothetical protein
MESPSGRKPVDPFAHMMQFGIYFQYFKERINEHAIQRSHRLSAAVSAFIGRMPC